MFFETNNLCFSYYRSPLCLKDINLSCEKYSKNLILASNEMGKTTLLKVLSGFEDSRFGNIYLEKKELKEIDDKLKNFSLVLSEPVLLDNKTIKQNIDYLCEVNEIDNLSETEINQLLVEFNVKQSSDVKIKKLSLLEKRKIQILRALIKKPTILFLDDQFEYLEEDEVDEMFLIYQKLLNRDDLTIIFSVSDESYKKIELLKCHIDSVFYLNFAKIFQFNSLDAFEKSYLTLDSLKFLNDIKTISAYIEKDHKDYYLCMDETRLFKFDSNFNIKLNLLELEFGDIEECEVLCLNIENISDLDYFKFNKMLKECKIYIFSSLTGNRII